MPHTEKSVFLAEKRRNFGRSKKEQRRVGREKPQMLDKCIIVCDPLPFVFSNHDSPVRCSLIDEARGLSGLGPGFGGSSSNRHRVGSSGRRRVDGPVDHPLQRPRHGPSGVQSRAFSPGPGVCKKAGGDCVPRSDPSRPLDRDDPLPGSASAESTVSVSGPFFPPSVDASSSSPSRSQDSACRSFAAFVGSFSAFAFLICLQWLHSCLLAGMSLFRFQAQAPPFSGLPHPTGSTDEGWRTLPLLGIQMSWDLSRTFWVPFSLFLWDELSILLGPSFICGPSLSLMSRVLAFCPCFSSLSKPSEGLSLLALVPHRPTLLCHRAPGCCFPGQFEMLSFPTWGLMIDSKQFFNVSSSPCLHSFRVCDFYDFSPALRDLSSWLSILGHFITLTTLDVCPSLSVCLVSLSFCLSVHLCLSVCLSVCLCLSVSLSAFLSLFLSVALSGCLAVCLFEK